MEAVLAPLIGGVIIGISSCIVLYSLGRITGVSGILASYLMNEDKNLLNWKLFFILGLIFGGIFLKLLSPSLFDYSFNSSLSLMVIAGLCVGVGTRLGSGCTSGHGVCGLPRKSARSLIATITFMLFGVITVYLKGVLL